MSHTEHVLGIDFGTATSCVAVVRDGEPTMLADPAGHSIIPTVVNYTPDGRVLVGHEAKPYQVSDPENTIASFKRILGRRWDDPGLNTARTGFPYHVVAEGESGVVIETRQGRHSLAEVAAEVLRYLKMMAEQQLGTKVTQAVIAVPTMWNDAQRGATRIAGRIAGLDVLGVINEPTAAALAFGYDRRDAQVLCIYDFGGGTFDFTILEIEGPLVRVVAAAGDAFLGGDDLDRALAFAAAEAFNVETGRHLWRDAAEWQRLLFACEEAKIRLSDRPRAMVHLSKAAHTTSGPRDLLFALDRRKMLSICGNKIKRSFELCTRALSEAGIHQSHVDGVMLVGGTTYVRLVRAGVTNFFGLRPNVGVNPVRAVALGAAIQGAALAGLPVVTGSHQTLLEVTPHALAVAAGDNLHVVIDKNEPIPAQEIRAYTTSADNQTEIRLAVYHGDPDALDEGCYLGEVVLDGLAPAAAGQTIVDVAFQISDQNRVSISATDRATQKNVACTLGADQYGENAPEKVSHMLQTFLVEDDS